MTRAETMQRIHSVGLIPAVRVSSESEVLLVLESLLAGGIDVAEIAMSMPDSLPLLQSAIRHFGDSMLLGAGTVLDSETARICILSGAKFILSPSLDLAVIEMGRRYSIAVMPGALTPTEIMTAWSAGADCVKVFPVGAVGGAPYIRSVRAPLPQVQLMPMGGVSIENAAEYFAAGSFLLGVGNDLTAAGSADAISKRAAEYVAAAALRPH